MKFAFLFVLLCSSISSIARDYYVNASTGDPKFNGLHPNQAKKTIQEAADLTLPGDTVFIMAGTYTNDCATCNVVTITRSGTSTKPIVYTNYPNQKPILRFNGWGGISIQDGGSHIVISGLEVIGNNANVTLPQAKNQPAGCVSKRGTIDPIFNGNGIVIDGRKGKHPHHIRIAKNKVHDCGGGGISANQADYITVEDNLVYNNCKYSLFGTSGISFYQFWNSDKKPGYHNIIRRNKTYNNQSYVPWNSLCKITDGNGIIVDDFQNTQNGSRLGKYVGRTLIENNVSWCNGGTGIHTFKSDHVDIINNTAYCNSQSTELNAGQILSGFGNDNRISNNILVSDFGNIINSNYRNRRLTYTNNLHYYIPSPQNAKINITNETCVNGKSPGFEQPFGGLSASFKLRAGSPAIAMGSSSLFSMTDFTGKKRQKVKVDIGAYIF